MKLKNTKYTIVILSLVTILLLGGAVLYSGMRAENARQFAFEAAQKARQAAVQEYEVVLTGFVRDIAKEMKVYKTQRTILREITRAHNFQSKEDAQKNYDEFKGVVVPGLRDQGEKVLKVFDAYSQKIDQVLQTKPEETKKFIKLRWSMMHDKEYQYYRSFFTSDLAVLMGYQELLKFYADKFGTYKIVDDKFVFEDPQDLKAEQELLKIIKDMQVSENPSPKKVP